MGIAWKVIQWNTDGKFRIRHQKSSRSCCQAMVRDGPVAG